MLFRKWGCSAGSENSIFRKLKSVDPKKQPLTTEMLLHFYFPFKAFSENERERERARARAREEKIQSKSRAPAPVRDRELQSELQLQSEARSREEGESRSRRRSRSRCQIAIAPSIAITARSSLMILFFLGCGLCFLICVFLLLFQTPNTRKYFPENFLKCNQTHRNIFLFRKLAFPENMYFPENVLQQPNTA